MFLKILLSTLLLVRLVISMSIIINKDNPQGNSVVAKMITKLIKESGRSIVHFCNFNSEFLSHIAQSNELDVTVVVNDFRNISVSEERKIEVTILHLENLLEFHRFFDVIRQGNFSHTGYFIILCDKTDEREMGETFSQFWKIYIFNVNVLVPSDNTYSVSMFTYMPFANGSCNSTKRVLINQFNRSTSNWTTNVFFPKKFKQLNRCPIRFGSNLNYPRFMISTENGVKKITGAVVDVGNMLGDALNFTANFLHFQETIVQLMNRVKNNEADLALNSPVTNRMEVMSMTRALHIDKLVMIVPPPFLIGWMEKLLLPFSSASWALIGLAVLLSCCMITLLHFAPKAFRGYVIGSRVKGTMLNVWNIFLGGPVTIVPQRNFPRFVLVKLLIFSLIIRSLYQGKIFDILKRDVQTVQLKTINDYIEHQFTFYLYRSIVPTVQSMKLSNNTRYVVYDDSDIPQYRLKTLNSSFNGIVVCYALQIMYANLMNRKNFTLNIAEEVMKTTSMNFYFTKNFYLYSEFDNLLYLADSAGLLDRIMLKYMDPNLLNAVEKQPPTALDYGNTRGIFELFYYGCALALFSFICEIVFGCNKSTIEICSALQRMLHFKR